jgi:hypothetical protein
MTAGWYRRIFFNRDLRLCFWKLRTKGDKEVTKKILILLSAQPRVAIEEIFTYVEFITASGPNGLKTINNWGSSVRDAIKAINIANPANRPK